MEKLIQLKNTNQSEACGSCKYNSNCKLSPGYIKIGRCDAHDGQHYPKIIKIKQQYYFY
jgi:hypothetical protein